MNRIRVEYEDRFKMLEKDNRFSYCEVDRELYNKMKSVNYSGNISIYFINKEGKEYGFTIDNINTIKESRG